MEELDPKFVKSHAVWILWREDSSLSLITVTISTSAWLFLLGKTRKSSFFTVVLSSFCRRESQWAKKLNFVHKKFDFRITYLFSNFCQNMRHTKGHDLHEFWHYENWKWTIQTHCNIIVTSKVHIFWEGHKILWNLHRRFVLCCNGQIYGGYFAKFCGLLRIYEL